MLSANTPPPTPFEAVWADIQLLLEWQSGFCLIWVLGDDQRETARLAQRLRDYTQARTRPLRTVRPAAPDTAVSDVLQAIFAPEPDGISRAAPPVWVDLMPGPQDPAWQTARQQVLAALNQRRSQLETRFARPLLLHLPMAMAGDIVSWAPDLWSVRALVAVLPSGDPHAAWGHDRLRDLSVRLDNAGQSELDRGRLDAALAAFRESLALLQRLREQLGDTPQVLRDLRWVLHRLIDLGDAVVADPERQAWLGMLDALPATDSPGD